MRSTTLKLPAGLVAPTVAIFALTACFEVGPDYPATEPAELVQAAEVQPADGQTTLLRVMSYNLKFGGGRIDFFFDGWGERVHMSREEVHANLDALLGLVAEIDPDILLVQEIDRDSRRTAFVDQVQYIVDHSKLNYGAFVHFWRADFVPDHGLGQMNAGLAIFSRYPLEQAVRIDQGVIGEQDPLTRRFYLRRALCKAEVHLSAGRVVTAIDVHTAAYATDGTKQRQVDQALAEAMKVKGPLIVGGDFNSLPPGAAQREGFEDEKAVLTDEPVHYRGEDDIMKGFYEALHPAIPLADYQADEERYFSASVNKDVFWTRRLDYLFASRAFSAGGAVLQRPGDKWLGKPIASDPMKLSDHAPVVALLPLQ